MILKVEPERIVKRGEPGTARKASPDPHRPHPPQPEVQGVC
jgi:hypothetical protein